MESQSLPEQKTNTISAYKNGKEIQIDKRKVPENFDSSTHLLIMDSESDEKPPPAKTQKVETNEKKVVQKVPENSDALFEALVKQITYTDIVELVLKYLKQKKGTPADLVELLEQLKKRILDLMETVSICSDGISSQQLDDKEGSKIIKLIKYHKSAEQVLVDWSLKLLYSANKNKKTPAYMMKSILISLDKIEFEREKEVYRKKALEMIEILKANCYQKLIEVFKLQNEVDFFKEMAVKKMDEDKPRDVVMLSQIFPCILEVFEKNGTKNIRRDLMRKLIQQNDVTTARLLVQNEDDKLFLIRAQYMQTSNAKKTAALIKEYELSDEIISKEFPEIEDKILNDGMNFYMMQFECSFKHFREENLFRCADFLKDCGPQKYGKGLGWLIERLMKHSIEDEARFLFDQNRDLVEPCLSEFMIQQILKIELEDGFEPLRDCFGPLSTSSLEHHLKIPNDVKVHFIESEQDLELLEGFLKESEVVGIDTEWRPAINIFHRTQGPAILQLSDGQTWATIVDLISLRESKTFSDLLRKMFDEKIIIGFGFQSDIAQLEEFEPFKKIGKFVDLQTVFQAELKLANPPKLQAIVEESFKVNSAMFEIGGDQKPEKVTLCKIEQMSNWERRPLRKSQLHYAAMDAFILGSIYQNMNYVCKNFNPEKYIKALTQNE